MKPEIALKLEYSLLGAYTKKQVEAIRDEWIAAYREVAEGDSSKKALCDLLAERIDRAAKLFILRYIEPATSDAARGSDCHRECSEEMKQKENGTLDGDFALGNEEDMVFASPYFSVKELTMIQTGCSESIVADRIPEIKEMRGGFLKEIKGLLMDAREDYQAYYSRNRFTNTDVTAADQRRDYLDSKMNLAREYELLLAVSAEADQFGSDLSYIRRKLSYSYSYLREQARVARDDEFMRKYEHKMVECYENALERNYQRIREYKERGIVDFSETDVWMLTFDKNGRPTKTTVIGVGEYGAPIYADGCTDGYFGQRRSNVEACCSNLGDRLPYNDNLYELLEAALKLKEQGPLGAEPYPTPNYDLSGLSGERLDAAAWQNYAIENGMVRHVDYDASLNRLIAGAKELIELYENTLSIV